MKKILIILMGIFLITIISQLGFVSADGKFNDEVGSTSCDEVTYKKNYNKMSIQLYNLCVRFFFFLFILTVFFLAKRSKNHQQRRV